MTRRYDTWPDALDCARCDRTFDAPTRDEMFDSGSGGLAMPLLCRGCEAIEDFFRLLQLHRVNHIHPRGRCLRELRRAA